MPAVLLLVLMLAVVAAAVLFLLWDGTSLAGYHGHRREANDLAGRCVDRLIVGDVDGARQVAEQARAAEDRALDLLLS